MSFYGDDMCNLSSRNFTSGGDLNYIKEPEATFSSELFGILEKSVFEESHRECNNSIRYYNAYTDWNS
jgi:hypothetical protein